MSEIKTIRIPIGRIFDVLDGQQIEEIGLNPWCLNEGLANEDDLYTIPLSKALQLGLVREEDLNNY